MRTVLKKPDSAPPYSLHDAYVRKIQVRGDTLRLITQSGYVSTLGPCEQVEGDVEITGIDWDFSSAYIMEYQDVLCGNYGSFTGKKMTVEKFLQEYPEMGLDIMDETFGYHQVKLDGYLNLGNRCLEFRLELCYDGEFRYLLKD